MNKGSVWSSKKGLWHTHPVSSPCRQVKTQRHDLFCNLGPSWIILAPRINQFAFIQHIFFYLLFLIKSLIQHFGTAAHQTIHMLLSSCHANITREREGLKKLATVIALMSFTSLIKMHDKLHESCKVIVELQNVRKSWHEYKMVWDLQRF